VSRESEPFSRRQRYRPEPDITIRDVAPGWLRYQVLQIACDVGVTTSRIVRVVRRVLLATPDPYSDSTWDETVEHLRTCEWYKVYDVAEGLYSELAHPYVTDAAVQYESELNAVLRDGGVGWHMIVGRFVVGGSEPFEAAMREASDTLARHARPTASRELQEALLDLSRRPEPDLSGAVHHATNALECVARDVSGDAGATLGKVISQHAQALGIVPPLNQALVKLWGYASEQGRHLREGRDPGFEEVELVVTIAAAVSTYLSKKSHYLSEASEGRSHGPQRDPCFGMRSRSSDGGGA
jgi:AbiJ N-terminal domain 4